MATTNKDTIDTRQHEAFEASAGDMGEATVTTEGETSGIVEKWAYVAGGAAIAVAGGALLAKRLTSKSADGDHSPNASVGHKEGVRVERTVSINKPADELYRYWRNFENLPHFMEHVESVHVEGDTRSHWTVTAPAGKTVQWDAKIINDIPNELIAWQTTHGDVANAGSVRFRTAPGGKGTEVTVNLEYAPPAGKVGQVVAKLFGEEPMQQVQDDLRRFKQVMEAGEVPTTAGQSKGK